MVEAAARSGETMLIEVNYLISYDFKFSWMDVQLVAIIIYVQTEFIIHVC